MTPEQHARRCAYLNDYYRKNREALLAQQKALRDSKKEKARKMPPSDRITRAWELRRAIHAFVLESPRVLMLEIFLHFPDCNRETLRKAVIRMRRDGDIAMVGRRGSEGHYVAVSSEIRPLEVTRERIRAGSARSHELARARKAGIELKKLEQDEIEERQRAAAKKAAQPWKTVHHCGDTRPADDSRGQGAVRPTVYVNCYQNF